MKNKKIINRDRISHILDSIKTIEYFMEKYSKTSFLDDRKTIDATLFQFAGEKPIYGTPTLSSRL